MANSSNGWTAERRARQSAAIHLWRPWEKSTGPKTVAGKFASSRNADRPNSVRRQLHDFLAGVRLDLERDRLR